MRPERALLIAVKFPQDPPERVALALEELQELAETAGAEVVDALVQPRRDIDPKFYIGKGRVSEIREFYRDDGGGHGVDVVIMNEELSPTQARNLEKELGKKVVTRTELILDIFAIHARSRTAKLQVELAQLQYELPRMTGKGVEMSRLGGGIGTRGPGEQQLELDRRVVQKKIHLIRKKLEQIGVDREIQRRNRNEREFKAALIGYTNSGKSTLLNRLTRSDVLVEDKLFATLDTTTRRLWLGQDELSGKPWQVVLTDTVGFIQDIPHGLIESFRSTFADTASADILIHVLDSSSRDRDIKKGVVEQTLQEIGASGVPVLLCFNKTDLVPEDRLMDVRLENPDALFISARDGVNLDCLKRKILDAFLAWQRAGENRSETRGNSLQESSSGDMM